MNTVMVISHAALPAIQTYTGHERSQNRSIMNGTERLTATALASNGMSAEVVWKTKHATPSAIPPPHWTSDICR